MRRAVAGLMAVTAIVWAFGLALRVDAAGACDQALSDAPDELVLVREIYDFLDQLDAAECPDKVPGALDALIDTRALNLVSYAMLEERLGASDLTTASAMVTETLDGLETAQAGLDAGAVLMLVDIAYRPCGGDEGCVGDRLAGWIGDRVLTGDAACTFGMTVTCETPDRVPFPNEATVRLHDTPAMRKARGDFVCGRYGDCKRGAF